VYPALATGLAHWIVMAHSLVEPPEGGLLEVTPKADTDGVPFIPHQGKVGSHEEFRKTVKVFVTFVDARYLSKRGIEASRPRSPPSRPASGLYGADRDRTGGSLHGDA
jgi:hypothetical protein